VTENGVSEPGSSSAVGPITTWTANSGDLNVDYDDTVAGAGTVQLTVTNVVPEPASLALLALGSLGLLARRRRRWE
jgi:hypothetical protein